MQSQEDAVFVGCRNIPGYGDYLDLSRVMQLFRDTEKKVIIIIIVSVSKSV